MLDLCEAFPVAMPVEAKITSIHPSTSTPIGFFFLLF
jgi:hypothetical protein